MKRFARLFSGLGLLLPALVFPPPAVAQPSGAAATPSPRNANYTLEVALDAETRTLAGRQRLTWRNLQQTATGELWFHLYWNAWRNDRSTWMLEDRIRGRSDRGEEIAEEDWGWIEVDRVTLLSALSAAPPAAASSSDAPVDPPRSGLGDLSGALRFASPDDGNPDDRTVMVVTLPAPVAPGETVEVELVWRAKVPRTFARTGFRGDYYFLAHWFPKLGVFEAEGWNCHQFHAATEFYSDYGVYDVSMTVPEKFVLGATGHRAEVRENGDGTVTHRYLQEDIHAFTWTASPDYLVLEERFEVPDLPAVDMRLLIQPEHAGQAERHFAATRAALDLYGRWYGAYPYGHVTVVDPAFGSGTAGMEYPTLFTCGTRLFNPLGGGSPEGVTIHEAGHQFWYGLVGNNEFEDAWIDEGLNTFSTARVYQERYGERIFMERYFKPPGSDRSGFFPLLLRDIRADRAVGGNRLDRYRRSATYDRQSKPTFLYYPSTASGITYSKTSLWLATLERHLGWETLRGILSTFFERWKFAHPGPEDFIAVANEVSGEDLGWFFDQVLDSSESFDYLIEKVATKPAEIEGYVEEQDTLAYRPPVKSIKAAETAAGEEKEEESSDRSYRSEVIVRRAGSGVFPVEILLVFEDGSEARHRWDGRERWTRIVETRPSKLVSAVVDPERVLLLDLDYTNNSRLVEPQAKLPAIKWASKWMIWLQDLLTAFAFFA